MKFYFAGPVELLDPEETKIFMDVLTPIIIGTLGLSLALIMWIIYRYIRFVKHNPAPRLLIFSVIASIAVGLYIFLVFVRPNFQD